MPHLSPITPLTIEGIRAWLWCGNAWSDGPAFKSVDEFVRNDAHPLNERAEALRIMATKGMGLSGPEAGEDLEDKDLVLEYITSIDEE